MRSGDALESPVNATASAEAEPNHNLERSLTIADADGSESSRPSLAEDSSPRQTIQSSNGFYQNPFGGNTSASINTAFFPAFPSLMWDSWVTIGFENTMYNNMDDIGIDWSEFEAGSNLQVDNGDWFVPLGEPQSVAGDDLRVLVAQLTTFGWDSSISGMINVFGRNVQGEFYTARDQYFVSHIPSPHVGALFLLGMGLSKRRR